MKLLDYTEEVSEQQLQVSFKCSGSKGLCKGHNYVWLCKGLNDV